MDIFPESCKVCEFNLKCLMVDQHPVYFQMGCTNYCYIYSLILKTEKKLDNVRKSCYNSTYEWEKK